MRASNSYNLPIILGAIALLFILERIFPLRKQNKPLLPRLLVNATFSVLTYATAAMIVKPVAHWALNYSEQVQFGLLHWLKLTPKLSFAFGFLLLDLSFYYWHRASHTFSFLWRFHNIHHLDPDLDVSSGFRFHFIEVALSAGFRLVQVMLIGPSLAAYAIYELFFQLETYFHHSNLGLPLAVDKALNIIFVTPRMHGIHHSKIQEEANSNYSSVFNFWDRINGSFRKDIIQSEINIGVPGYSSEEDNQLKGIILAPFLQQKKYW